ncbi:hypothetical protein LUQ84_002659 [Hamiltosporidium tvaerminnensis]|nr:hypothetical protein LUQ84_002659 [Hamiltosporidium tvaerminnensis]
MVGGSMGTYSYIVCIGNKGVFNSCCHGSGRLLSRKEGLKRYEGEGVVKEMERKNIVLRCSSVKGVGEEADGCYKDVVGVVEYSDRMGLTRRLCRLKPLIVIKG